MPAESTLIGVATLALLASAVPASAVPASAAQAATTNGPCDIYASGGAPCVAAYATTRALYAAYSGPLYQVIRGSDNATQDIAPVSAGGIANSGAQDSFCSGTTCLIKTLYDQSGKGNHLTQAPGGGHCGPDYNCQDNLAAGSGAAVTLNGNKVYGVFFSPGTGYRNDNTNGIATGTQAESLYAVYDSTHYNNGCCFDFGNAEPDIRATVGGYMETIYIGQGGGYGSGTGNGPWVMADLEAGVYSGYGPGQNADPTISSRFVSAFLKGNSSNLWGLSSANAQSGSITPIYYGVYPNNSQGGQYWPMHKQGAIVLGVGGDNAPDGTGTFFEGVMTRGFASNATEAAVQANIVAAKFAATSLVSGPALTVGSKVTIKVTTPGYTNRYLAHSGSTVNTQVISSSSNSSTQATGEWYVRAALAGDPTCFSFESADQSGQYIKHSGFQLVLGNDGSKTGFEDSTWCPQAGLNGQGNSIRSWSYPTRYFRHTYNVGYAASNGGQQSFDAPQNFNNDASFIIGSGFN